MKHDASIGRRGIKKPSLAIKQIDDAVNRSWTEMASWMPEQRRENLPVLLNAIGRLETRLMVLRQGVKREIEVWNELVKPSRGGVVPDEDDEGGD